MLNTFYPPMPLRSLRTGFRLSLASLGLFAVSLVRGQADGTQRWAFTTLSTATAGSIVSSPAVGPDGTLYIGIEVGTSSSANPSGRLMAINPNGSLKWEYTVPEWVDSTPAVAADGTIYFGAWNGNLYALRPDRTLLWTLHVGAFVASSPALGADGTIYIGAGSDLVAVAPNGTLKWSFPAADWIDSSPAVAPDGTIHFGSWDDHVYALRPDGTLKWKYLTGGNVVSSPAIAADGTVYAGSRDAGMYALSAAGALQWKFDTRDTVETAPALAPDGTIYVTSTGGRLHAFNRDGTEKWRYPAGSLPGLNAIYSSPAVRADGSVVFGSSNNAVYAVRPDGTLLWSRAIGDWSDSSPVVTADAIYIGSADKKLYALNSTPGPLATDWPQFRRTAERNGWQPMGAAAGTTGRLMNVSVRTFAGADQDTLIVGFAVSGSGGRSLLVRGVGPTLVQFGVNGALANPNIALINGGGVLGTNDDWEQPPNNAGAIAATSSSVGAFPLPRGSLDSALQRDFAPGTYTVHVAGAGAATGVALMEVYDASGAAGARVSNVSARSAVSAGSGTLIAGFVVSGQPRTILVRGIGPALTAFGVSGALPNPQLRVFRGDTVLAENNDWSVSTNAAAIATSARAVGAFALQDGTADAVLLVTLPPGAYTAQVSAAGGSAPTGVALVEVYEIP